MTVTFPAWSASLPFQLSLSLQGPGRSCSPVSSYINIYMRSAPSRRAIPDGRTVDDTVSVA